MLKRVCAAFVCLNLIVMLFGPGWSAASPAHADEPAPTSLATPPGETPLPATEAPATPSDATPAPEIPTEASLDTTPDGPPGSPTPALETPSPEPVTATPGWTETATETATLAPTAVETPTEAPVEPPTVAPTETAPPSATPSEAAPATPSPTASPSPEASPTPLVMLQPPPVPGPPLPEGLAALSNPPSTSLVISQVYGGGGNVGAPYANDFVELYNLGAAAVDIGGWSVQYASATSATWQVTPLAGLIPPGGFWLIQLGSGGSDGAPLPAPDATGGTNLAASAGKVALVNTASALSGACPASAAIVDFVGYGASANCFETAPAGGLGNAIAALRLSLADTNVNSADFSVAAPSPHGGASPATPSSPTATSTPPTTATPTQTGALPSPTATYAATGTPTLTDTPTETGTPTGTPTATLTPNAAQPGAVLINEVVTNPQQDWSGGNFGSAPGSGSVSDTDEFVELLITSGGLDLSGWTIELLDGSDVIGDLTASGAFQVAHYLGSGSFTHTAAGDYLVLGNVRGSGSLNNAVTIILKDATGAVVDRVSLGAGGVPGGDAASTLDEAVARRPNGSGAWVNQAATPGASNDSAPAVPTSTPTLTLTPTGTPTLTPTAGAYPLHAVLINEVAWAGTAASSNDEWLELFNPGPASIPLGGWTLADGGDIAIVFPAGLEIPAGGYLLLERTDDSTVSDIGADVIYSGGLSNDGEALRLSDVLGNVIDTAGGGAWLAGDAANYASMERAGAEGGWLTHHGMASGLDANGHRLRGTPRGPNSLYLPTPTPEAFSTTILLNEFLAVPGDGAQEFVEIINVGGAPVDVSGWKLDDASGGSRPFSLSEGTLLPPGALLVFFHDVTGLALNNTRDTVRLLFPDDRVADEFAYSRNPGEGVSWARVPDGGSWAVHGAPSPGASNGLTAAPLPSKPSRPSLLATAEVVPIGTFREWPVGAWAKISGRVVVPAPLFGKRLIYIQDETGSIAVYLGRGDWPVLEVGQWVTVFGYSRVQGGQLQMYVRNGSLISVGTPNGQAAAPLVDVPVNASTLGSLVTLTGRVVRLESSAFWLEAGDGPVRVFFASSTGVRRPKVARGDVWTVTGVVVPMTATKTRAAGYQLQPRFADDVRPVSARYVEPAETEMPTLPEALSTEGPTATP